MSMGYVGIFILRRPARVRAFWWSRSWGPNAVAFSWYVPFCLVAQIAVTLVALSGGYYAGSWLVDQSPKLNRLYYGILAAAVYLAATVPMVKPLCLKLMSLPLAWATLLAAMFCFWCRWLCSR